MMKMHAFRILTILGLFGLLMVPPVSGQSLRRMTVIIPFDFACARKHLPAGTYTVEPAQPSLGDAVGSGLMLRSADGRVSVIVPFTKSVTASRGPAPGELMFNRYGNQYFLSQVWTAGSEIGWELFKSPEERKSASRERMPFMLSVKAQKP